MGSTTMDRIFVALIFVALIGAGFCIDVRSVWEERATFPRQAMTWSGLASGDNARVVEDWLAEHSDLKKTIRPVYNEILFRTTGTAGKEVAVGPNMLFHRPRVRGHHAAYWTKRAEDFVATATNYQEALRPFGAKLVVAIVPDKIRAYPKGLPDFDFEASPKEVYYENLMLGFAAAGIRYLDVVDLFRQHQLIHGPEVLFFHRDDTHWNSLGARVTAEALAKELQSLGVEQGQLESSLVLKTQEHVGNMIVKAGWDPKSWTAQRYRDPLLVNQAYDENMDRIMAPWDGEVVLTTDSFGGQLIPGIISHLMKRRIPVVIKAGKGPLYSPHLLLKLLRRGWRPKVVVWVFEEAGSYFGGKQSDIFFNELVPDENSEPQVSALPIEAVDVGQGAEGGWSANEFHFTNVGQYCELEIDRQAVQGQWLIFNLKAAYQKVRKTMMALLDESDSQRRSKILPEKSKIVLDGDTPLLWERVVLPVPAGSGKLILALSKKERGGKFLIRHIGHSCRRMPTGPTMTWQPSVFVRLRPGFRGAWAVEPRVRSLKPVVIGGDRYAVGWSDRTCQWIFAEELPVEGGRLDFYLYADGPAKGPSAEATFGVYLNSPSGKEEWRLWRQVVKVVPGQRVSKEVSIDIPAGDVGARQLKIELWMPRDRGTAGVAFPRR